MDVSGWVQIGRWLETGGPEPRPADDYHGRCCLDPLVIYSQRLSKAAATSSQLVSQSHLEPAYVGLLLYTVDSFSKMQGASLLCECFV